MASLEFSDIVFGTMQKLTKGGLPWVMLRLTSRRRIKSEGPNGTQIDRGNWPGVFVMEIDGIDVPCRPKLEDRADPDPSEHGEEADAVQEPEG